MRSDVPPASPTPGAIASALVLCGGASRRMGRDKALLEIDGSTFLARAASELARAFVPVRLACGASPRYAELGHELVLDRAAGLGPLAGLAAGLARAERDDPAGWVAVVAVDMPNVRAELLFDLVERARSSGLDALLLESDSGIEPLCGAYRAALARAAERALDAGERRVVAFERHPLANGALPRVGSIALDDLAAVNVNTPHDLERELRRSRGVA